MLAIFIVQPVSWSGSPIWEPDSDSMPHVRTVFHKAEITLSKSSARYKAKTLLKNTGATTVTGRVLVPVIGRDGTDEWFRTDVSANWGGVPAKGLGLQADMNVESNWSHWYGFRVSMKPGEWKAFESTLTRPLNKSGEGWAERFVTYLVQPYQDQLEQFQLAVKFPKDLVFQTAVVSPNMGWQIGERGAFYSKRDWRPGKTAFRFQFYPGTFERIGG